MICSMPSSHARAVPSGDSIVRSTSSVPILIPARIGRVGTTRARYGQDMDTHGALVGISSANTSCCTNCSNRNGRSHLPPRFSVAPMMDWTDNNYRTLARHMSKHAWLYSEMVVADTINYQKDNLDKLLKFSEAQHPIVLQLGGNNPEKLFRAAQLASPYKYDEINLNCGCPSDKVSSYCFGASLMLEPELVGKCVTAIGEGCPGTPVTVKCRIGVDDFDSYDFLYEFVRIVSSTSPAEHFIIHARKAMLKGLTPALNRVVPPLKYEYFYALVRDFPHLKFTLNGGVVNIHQVNEALQRGAFGVMLGRAAYTSPWNILGNVDSVIYGDATPGLTRRQILTKYEEYADAELHKYGYKKPGVRQLAQPLQGLFHSEKGVGFWRRAVEESIQRSKTVGDLLNETLRVIPDSVLDTLPRLETSPDFLLANLGPLPLAPSFGSVKPSLGLEHSASQFPSTEVLAN